MGKHSRDEEPADPFYHPSQGGYGRMQPSINELIDEERDMLAPDLSDLEALVKAYCNALDTSDDSNGWPAFDRIGRAWHQLRVMYPEIEPIAERYSL